VLIAIDIDDVLADLSHPLVAFHNETYGTRFRREDHMDYNLESVWGGTARESYDKVMRFFASPYFAEVRPVPGAVDGVRVLRDLGHDLVVITSRPEGIMKKTAGWIEAFFPRAFNDILCATHYYNRDYNKKSGLCTRLGVELILDDCLEIALECAQEGIRVLLYNAPWNQVSSLPEGITRVFSWDEIVAAVREAAPLER
jgi:uncharacterized HAD superfamily protein